MTSTEIFKTSFETIKAHKKQVIILCLLNVILRLALYCISWLPSLITGVFSAFLTTLVFLPFIYKLQNAVQNRKTLLISALSYTLISTIANSLNLALTSLLISILKSLIGHSAMSVIYNLILLPVNLILLILLTVIEYFGIFAVSEAKHPLKSVKLLRSKLKSGFITKIIKVAIISIIINFIPAFLAKIIEGIVIIDVTNTIQFKIISIPFYIYTFACMFTYWSSIEQNEN